VTALAEATHTIAGLEAIVQYERQQCMVAIRERDRAQDLQRAQARILDDRRLAVGERPLYREAFAAAPDLLEAMRVIRWAASNAAL
jgi:hypothetical protein